MPSERELRRMSDKSSVRGTILSSSPCSVPEAAALLKQFLASETVPESNLVRGYLGSVIGALDELAAVPKQNRKERSGKKKNGVDTAGDDLNPPDETPAATLKVREPPEHVDSLETSSKRSKKRKNLITDIGSLKFTADTPAAALQERESAEPIDSGENSSKRSRKQKNFATNAENLKSLAETPGVQLQLGDSGEPAEPSENGSKRSRKKKNLDSASEDQKVFGENAGMLPRPSDGSKHGSHSMKKRRHGVEPDLSADDASVKRRSKKHRMSELGQKEDNVGKSSSSPSEFLARLGDIEPVGQRMSGLAFDRSQGVAQGAGAGATEIGKEEISTDGFSLRTRDPDDLSNNVNQGVKESKRSKGSTSKGSHSKKHHSDAAEPEDRSSPDGRHSRELDPGSGIRSTSMPNGSHSKPEDHAVSLGTSGHGGHETLLDNQGTKKTKRKKSVDTMRSEGQQNSEEKRSHQKIT